MREPHVVHLVPSPFSATEGIIGGAERYAFELARYMSAGVPTRLVTFGPHDRRDVLGDLSVDRRGFQAGARDGMPPFEHRHQHSSDGALRHRVNQPPAW